MYVVCDKTKLVGVLFEKELNASHNTTLAIVLACMVVGRLHQHGEGKGNETGKQRQRQQGRAQCIIFGSGA